MSEEDGEGFLEMQGQCHERPGRGKTMISFMRWMSAGQTSASVTCVAVELEGFGRTAGRNKR